MDQTTRQTPHNTQTEPSAVGNRAGRNQVGPSPTELTIVYVVGSHQQKQQ